MLSLDSLQPVTTCPNCGELIQFGINSITYHLDDTQIKIVYDYLCPTCLYEYEQEIRTGIGKIETNVLKERAK